MHPSHAYSAHTSQKDAQQAFDQQDWQNCIAHYGKRLGLEYPLDKENAKLFNTAKLKYHQSRKGQSPRIAVSGWEMSHNAAGRALTLAQLYKHLEFDIIIIGCIISTNPNKPKSLWQPMKDSQQQINIECKYFRVANSSELLIKAVEFVRCNPFDIIHLSKPRLPNIILGRLYQLFWNTQIIMDIDDEELGFGKSNTQEIKKGFSLKTLKSTFTLLKDTHQNMSKTSEDTSSPLPADIMTIRSDYWLHHCVNLANSFDKTTVSNTALQAKYQGIIIPHVRDRHQFTPSRKLTEKMRKKHNIPLDSWVVLFFGTPKPHKGLLETAHALANINRDDVIFLIIGDFIEASFKAELKAINNVNYQFLPNQPFSEVPNFVAIGDICVLMQDTSSVISEHQLPAKVIDALAMSMTVICTDTPALRPLIDAHAVTPTTPEDLQDTLATFFSLPRSASINYVGYKYFVQYLSIQANQGKLSQLMKELQQALLHQKEGQVSHPIVSSKVYDLAFITEIKG